MRTNAVKLTDDPAHRDIVRMDEHKEALEQFFEAIDDNDTSLFDAIWLRVNRLEMP